MKLVYPAIFYYEESGGYSVEIPDLTGCITQGDNLAEAMEMSQDAATGWLNKRAEKIGVNFSQVLQESLLNKIVKANKK